jgi:hypothetical protein
MRHKLKTSLYFTVAVLLVGLVVPSIAGPTAADLKARSVEFYGKAPLSFEASQDRADARANFISRDNGYSIFLSPAQVTLVLRNAKLSAASRGKSASANPKSDMVTMKIVGAKITAKATVIELLPGKVNYFIGNDPKQWRTNISTYGRVKYENVYRGVDLAYYGNQRQLEFDFIVAPGANPQDIALKFEGAETLDLDAQGNLVVRTVSGQNIIEHKPVIYQEVNGVRKEVLGGYVLAENQQIRFQIAAYDQTKPLIIDPTLSYATYLGGTKEDYSQGGVAVDSKGNFYVAGYTTSIDFSKNRLAAVLPGQTSTGGLNPVGKDGFVTKFDPDGKIVYSFYVGSTTDNSQGTQVTGIAVDADQNVYIIGTTEDGEFPHTHGYQTTIGGGHDAFVTKINSLGDTVLYSTFFGGSLDEAGIGIALNSDRTVCITGNTASPKESFPITPGAFQSDNHGGLADAFVAKLDPSKSGTDSLIYSTYLGGKGSEDQLSVFNLRYNGGIAVDGDDNAYVTGNTDSSDGFLPTKDLSFMKTHTSISLNHSAVDAFVVKFDPKGNPLAASYLGGTDYDSGIAIAVDGEKNVYVTGLTQSSDFRKRQGQPDGFDSVLTRSSIVNGVFVAKLTSDLTKLLYGTYLGPGVGAGIAVDCNNNAYVTGNAKTGFPLVVPLSITGGIDGDDAFVAVLGKSGGLLSFSTRLGGSLDDTGAGIVIDSASGRIYVAGATKSKTQKNFPNAQISPSGNNDAGDAFVAIIDTCPPCGLTLPTTCTYNICPTSALVKSCNAAGSVSVITSPGCIWTATTDDIRIHLSNPCNPENGLNVSGKGSGTVIYTIIDATPTTPPTGTITIAGQTFTINQEAFNLNCSFKIMPDKPIIDCQGHPVGIRVLTDSCCKWTISTKTSWLHIVPLTESGEGGDCAFVLYADTYALTNTRLGTITIGGSPFDVIQTNCVKVASRPCTIAISQKFHGFPFEGGESSVAIETDADCRWSAKTTANWIHFSQGNAGVGNGVLHYTVDENEKIDSVPIGGPLPIHHRMGFIQIGNQRLTIEQVQRTQRIGRL